MQFDYHYMGRARSVHFSGNSSAKEGSSKELVLAGMLGPIKVSEAPDGEHFALIKNYNQLDNLIDKLTADDDSDPDSEARDAREVANMVYFANLVDSEVYWLYGSRTGEEGDV